MSFMSFYREISKVDREIEVIKELATIQMENELLSGIEKEKVEEEASKELLLKYDDHIAWLYKDAVKTKLVNIALSGGIIALGIAYVVK